MIAKTQSETDALKSTIDGLDNAEGCQLCDELKKQYEWSLIYLKQIKDSLAPCPEPKPSALELAQLANVTNYTKIPNLNT